MGGTMGQMQIRNGLVEVNIGAKFHCIPEHDEPLETFKSQAVFRHRKTHG